jgi:small-conductance mechanosensitive channel
MHWKCSRLIILIFVLTSAALVARAGDAPADPSEEVVKLLDTTIDWYRRVISFIQSPVNTDEVLFHDAVGQSTLQALRLGFTYGHAEADLLAATQKGAPIASPSTKGTTTSTVQQAAQQAAQRIAQLQAQLDEAQQEAQTASPTSQPVFDARRDKLKAALNLAQERQQVIADFQAFSTDQGAGGMGAQVDNLQRTIPEASSDPNAAAAPTPAATQETLAPQSLGVIGLISELFAQQRRMDDLKLLADQTDALMEANKVLRDPLRTSLLDTVHRSDALAREHDSNDPKVLDSERQEIETITARYKLIAAAMVPLGEQNLVLQSTRDNMLLWHEALQRDYKRVLSYLVIRLGGMAAALLVLMAVSKGWRRITYRYVTDIRRRRQFLIVRRLVVGSFVIIILIGGTVTEFGSLATYAGLLTAGIAVALQTVILSAVAHFFLIGRYGLRVGDRVTVGGITGDVIEIGLFRLYLMELGGAHVSLQPTGRVAVFANSVLFQPTAFYKQLPGAAYAWSELALTLSPDSDYKLAEQRLMSTVQEIYKEYRDAIVQQHSEMKDSLHFPIPVPEPEGNLHFVEAGLEFVVRYPVELRNAAEIDDRITRALVQVIEAEPKLKFVASGTPRIQAVEAK